MVRRVFGVLEHVGNLHHSASHTRPAGHAGAVERVDARRGAGDHCVAGGVDALGVQAEDVAGQQVQLGVVTAAQSPGGGDDLVEHGLQAQRAGHCAQDVGHRSTLVVETLLGQGGVHSGTQQCRVERLGEIVGSPDLDATHDAVEVLDGRDDDHREVAEVRVGLELLQGGEPVELGHLQVEQHGIDRGAVRRHAASPALAARSPR